MVEDRRDRIAYLLDKARGPDRSYREYARDAGVSSAAMTRMRKGDYIPKPDTIQKLTSAAAKPQGGVTYEELMLAAGYAVERKDEPDPETVKKLTDESAEDNDPDTQTTGEADKEDITETLREKHIANVQAGYKYDKEITAQIYMALVNKGIVFKLNENMREMKRKKDLCVELIEQPIKNMVFDFVYSRYEGSSLSISDFKLRMGNELFTKIDKDTKVTYVVNSMWLYQYLERYDHKLPLRREMSVILYDREAGIFVDEFYLSNYDEGDRSREVYLA